MHGRSVVRHIDRLLEDYRSFWEARLSAARTPRQRRLARQRLNRVTG